MPEPEAGRGSRGDAVELFAQRAAAVTPGFAVTAANRGDVIRLCRRLDGIPLAIELATVQLRTLTLRQLASRLERRFLPLAGGRLAALPHQQTLRLAISKRTVDAHLEHIFGKLGISSRVQLATRLDPHLSQPGRPAPG